MSDATTTVPARHRRIWPWLVGFCLAPFVILGAVAFSFLTLDRDARLLRREIMAATKGDWHTKVQLSVGRLTVDALRTVLLFVHERNVTEARCALAAVKGASVGVYEFATHEPVWARGQLLAKADAEMGRRGWTRLVGVAEPGRTVLVYANEDAGKGDLIDLCLAVVDGRDLVVVSTTVNAATLADFVEQQSGGDWQRALHRARL